VGDEEALMMLVKCNAQGELSPLEIGLHVLRAVPKEDGGRGKKGGLRGYAEAIGKDEGYIRQLRKAAEVVSETAESTPRFRDKSQHLCAIHALPPARAPAAVAALAQGEAADISAYDGGLPA
jgi:hypothetical protein